eukprot:187003-Prorocentrum_minimum.AAC.1
MIRNWRRVSSKSSRGLASQKAGSSSATRSCAARSSPAATKSRAPKVVSCRTRPVRVSGVTASGGGFTSSGGWIHSLRGWIHSLRGVDSPQPQGGGFTALEGWIHSLRGRQGAPKVVSCRTRPARGADWLSEDAQRALAPTTDRELRYSTQRGYMVCRMITGYQQQ